MRDLGMQLVCTKATSSPTDQAMIHHSPTRRLGWDALSAGVSTGADVAHQL